MIGTTSGGGDNCWCGTVFAVDFAGHEKTLHEFDPNEGEYPMDTLLYLDGALLGTTYTGGPYNFGTVFRLEYQ